MPDVILPTSAVVFSNSAAMLTDKTADFKGSMQKASEAK